jgi:hypothetical protein
VGILVASGPADMVVRIFDHLRARRIIPAP